MSNYSKERVLFKPLASAICFIGTNELRMVLVPILSTSEELKALLIFISSRNTLAPKMIKTDRLYNKKSPEPKWLGLSKWRRRWDSNPRNARTFDGFQDRSDQPLWHSSKQLLRMYYYNTNSILNVKN